VTGDRRPEPGERCRCGRAAVAVFIGSDGHETPWCGRSDVPPAEPLGARLQIAVATAFEECGEAWTDDHSGDRLARVATNAAEPLAAALVAEQCKEPRRLVEQALFLRQYGERPPGAPHDNLSAETWPDWDRRAEEWLRGDAS